MLSRHLSRAIPLLQASPRSESLRWSRGQPWVGRRYGSKNEADEHIERLQDQYATAKDEFEIASEESSKKSIYAADDRDAARDELAKLKDMYEKALAQSDASTKDEIKRRVGQRVRELDTAVNDMFKKSEFGDTDPNFADKPDAKWTAPSN